MSQTILEKKKKKRKKLLDVLKVRGEEEEEEIITGPLGIWFFPILNAILRFIKKLRSLRERRPTRTRRRRLAIYELVRDEYGRVAQIIEREIEE